MSVRFARVTIEFGADKRTVREEGDGEGDSQSSEGTTKLERTRLWCGDIRRG